MDIQYFGGNCVVLNTKDARIVIDDTLAELGHKSVTKPGDIVLRTHGDVENAAQAKIAINSPGEYEVANISIRGIAARAHMDEEKQNTTTMYKIDAGDVSVLVTGHIFPSLSDDDLETIGLVDVLVGRGVLVGV